MGNVFINNPQLNPTNRPTSSLTTAIPRKDASNSAEEDTADDEAYIRVSADYVHSKGSYGKTLIVRRSQEKATYYAMLQLNKMEVGLERYNEAMALASRLQLLERHENVVNFIDSYQELNKFYLVYEHAEKGTLRDQIEFQLSRGIHGVPEPHFDENLVRYWAGNILSGLQFLHARFIYHCDLKPENIFVDMRSGGCKLANFCLENLFKTQNQAQLSNFSASYHSPFYLPNEMRFHDLNELSQRLNWQKEDFVKWVYEKLDIFGFGCVLYEVIRLERLVKNPFKNELVLNFGANETPLVQLCKLLLSEDAHARPNCETLVEDALFGDEAVNEAGKKAFFKRHRVPTLNLERHYSLFIEKGNYLKRHLEMLNYEPSALVSLKSGKNIILVAFNKKFYEPDYNIIFTQGDKDQVDCDLDENADQFSRIHVYTEFAEFVYEFSYYYRASGERGGKKTYKKLKFNFKIFAMHVDEANSHLYLSTDAMGIIRFKLDLSLRKSGLLLDAVFNMSKIKFNNSDSLQPRLMCIDEDLEFVLFNDEISGLLVRLDLCRDEKAVWKDGVAEIGFSVAWSSPIRSPNRKLSNKGPKLNVSQILVVGKEEVVVLLDDQLSVYVFALADGSFKRDNLHLIQPKMGSKGVNFALNGVKINCVCLDSDCNVYSINDQKLFSIRLDSFQVYNSIDLFECSSDQYLMQNGYSVHQSVFSSIQFMQILSNGKIALIQKDGCKVGGSVSSVLFILRPFYRNNEVNYF